MEMLKEGRKEGKKDGWWMDGQGVLQEIQMTQAWEHMRTWKEERREGCCGEDSGFIREID